MVKAVLFDLDNTLIDFMKMKHMSCEAAISAMIDAGLKMKKEAAYKKLFRLYQKHGIEDSMIFQRFLRKFQGKIDYRILANGVAAYRRVQAGYLEPYPRVRSTLLKLKEQGIKLGVVSDAPRLKAWLRLAEMDLTHFFDFVVALDDTGKMKPSKMPFEKALKRLGMGAFEVLFVGDNPSRDIKGAQKIGMKTALAKYGQLFPLRGVKPDYELADVAGLLKIVRRK